MIDTETATAAASGTAAETIGLTSYSPEAPLLLLTDWPPDAGGGGAVILRSLLGPEERSRIVWASLQAPRSSAFSEDGAGGRLVTLQRGTASRSVGRSMLLDAIRDAEPLADEVADLASSTGARAIWVVMHGAAVHVAARLARRRILPMHLTIHDDPLHGVALLSKRYLPMIPWIARDFGRTLRAADSLDVIGQGMADRYRDRFGVDSVIVHRACSESVEPAPPLDRSVGLQVGILGSTYGYQPLPGLGRAIVEASRKLGVPARLLVCGTGDYGQRLAREMGGALEVEATGHVDELEGIERLRSCCALYLNYPFGRRAAGFRQTSFPTKLSTYLAVGRPLLIQAPKDSTTAPLEHLEPNLARLWNDPNPATGAAILERLWSDFPDPRATAEGAERLRLRYFDPARNRRTLFGALNAMAVGSALERS